MFKIKTFIALAVTAVLTVVMLQSAPVYADEKAPVVAASQQVNINKADANSIAASLKGIGLKKAEAIVEYREKFGAFKDIQELTEVKGIGSATLKKNEGVIVLD